MRSIEKVDLIVQMVASVFLVVSLCMHLTEVGFVGLGIAIIVTTCTGKIEEHDVSFRHRIVPDLAPARYRRRVPCN